MGKTTVDFVWEASSIYHCFFFLDLPQWCELLTLSDLRQPAPRLHRIYCLWLSSSVVNLITLNSAVGSSHIGWGRIPPGVGAIASPQAALLGGE